jgi:hypothetical protein
MYLHPTDPKKAYIAIPKTGSTTIAYAIQKAGGKMTGSHHSSVWERGEGNYECVAFVRNHYIRMVSWATHTNVSKADFEAVNDIPYVQDIIRRLLKSTHKVEHSKPDSLYARWLEGVKHVLRYEDGLFNQMAEVGWDCLTPPKHNLHVAHPYRRPWYEYYDAELAKLFEPYHEEMKRYRYEAREWDQ